MTCTLVLGDYTYSSWSLRGWLLFERFNIPQRTIRLDFSADSSVAEQLAPYAPARTVPTIVTPEGAVISDSLAIAEELATRHPAAGLWPDDPGVRATARSLAAEMHAGFGALRTDCPMNLRKAYTGVTPSGAVTADLRRLEELWDHARHTCAPDGPWLCGDYSIADVFYAPVAARIAGYGLQVSNSARAYVRAHLADPAFRRWRAIALVRGPDLLRYAKDHDTTAWPGPAPHPAKAVATGPSENTACPYSGKPVTHFLETGGRVFGFCNAFCRDKTVADPNAWPDFTALRDSTA